jgi:hypothetical protein
MLQGRGLSQLGQRQSTGVCRSARPHPAILTRQRRPLAPCSAVIDQAPSEAVASTSGRLLHEVAAASCCAGPTQAAGAPSGTLDIFSGISPTIILAFTGLSLLALAIKKVFDTPSRTYDGNVGEEYDAWTDEGVLEYYWGEHIHLGYYTGEERAAGYLKKDFKEAKYNFTDEMLRFSGAQAPKKILDVGCGFGGTSRHLAKKFKDATVQGAAYGMPAWQARMHVWHAMHTCRKSCMRLLW